jgi:hypothetical protein
MSENRFAPQEPAEPTKAELAEKFDDAVIESNRRAADLYLAEHQFSPWDIDDLGALAKEYRENPQYKTIFSNVLSASLNQMKDEEKTFVEDRLDYLPPSLHQRLTANAVALVAKDRGMIGAEDVNSITDLISSVEMAGTFIENEPIIAKKRRAQYLKLKQKLGKDALEKLNELTLAGYATSWLITAYSDPIGKFSPQDIGELAEEWQGAWEKANGDISNYSEAMAALKHGDDPKDYIGNVSSSFLQRRFDAIAKMPKGKRAKLFTNYKKTINTVASNVPDLTHSKAYSPHFDEYEQETPAESRSLVEGLFQ